MKFKKLSALILGAILTIGVAAGLGSKVENEKVEAATTKSVVIDANSFGLTKTATTAVTSKTYNGVTYSISSGAKLQSASGTNRFSSNAAILIGKSGAYIYNTTAFPGAITKFEVYANKGASTKVSVGVKFGNSPITSWNAAGAWTQTLGTLDSVYDASAKITDGAKYFRYQVTNANNSQVQFRITYQDTSAPTLSDISAELNDTTKKWYVGDKVTLDDITVTATYSGSTDKDVTKDVTLTNNILNNVGENVINISYTENGVTKTRTLTVNAQAQRTLTDVTLKGDMTKKEYNVGDSWDLSGLYLDLSYSVGDNEQIPLTDLTAGEDYILSEDNASDTSITSLDIYGEYEGIEFEITTIEGIKVNDVKTYSLVTNVDNLSIGSEIIIAASGYDKAISTTQNSNNRASAAVVKSNEGAAISAPGSDVQIFTLEAGTTDGTYAFNTGNGYIHAASSGSNHLKTQSTNNANGSWNIEIADTGVATIKADGEYTRNWLRFNSTNNPQIFSCYGSGQADVSLYQYLKPVEKKTVTSLEVDTSLSKTIYSVGDKVDPEEMVVNATYSDGATENVASECSFNPSVIGENTNQIIITYDYEDVSYTTTLDITLKAVKDVISVASKPNIYVGDTVDAGQFELNVEYNDGTTGTVQADEVNLDTTTAGVKEATATYNGASNTKTITFEVEVYGLTSLSWTNRGDHVAFEGSTLGEVFNTAEWKFTAKYNDENKTQLEPSPVFGTGENDVHVSLYDARNPETENTPLTSDYVFTLEDDGKFIVASYKGIFSSSNSSIDVVERLNNITNIISGSKETEIGLAGSTGDLNGTTISWENDGVVVTNEKGSSTTNIRTDDTDHYRCYAESILKINSDAEIQQIVFTCTSSEYAGKLVTSIGNDNATNDGTVVTWTSVNSKNITINLTAQVRIKSVVVSGSGETTYEYANNNLKAQAAVMEFVNFFNTTMTADGACSVDGTTDYNSDTFNTAWETVAAKWDELFGADSKLSSEDLAHAKAMFVNADAYWANEFADTDPLQRAMRTYDKVISNTNLSKFIEGRPKVEDNGVGIKALIDNNATTIALIVIIALFSGFAFLFVSKRKQRKIEL